MPRAAKRNRHVLTTRGRTPISRAIAREPLPSAASRMMRARRVMRCSVVDARNQLSSSLRVSGSSRICVALGIIPMLNHSAIQQHRPDAQMFAGRCSSDSPSNDCGY